LNKPVIFTKMPVVLQALQDAVGHGYTHYLAGSTPIEKIEQTVATFDFEHHAFADKNEKARLKRKNFGLVRAIMWHPRDSDRVFWWLLATAPDAGKNHIHASENLRDAMHPDQRLIVENLELVRQPRKGTSISKLTWRLTDDVYADLQKRIRDAIRSGSNHSMRNVLLLLWSIPGFAGVRSQIGYLTARYKNEVKRANIKDAPIPPKKLYYFRRMKHDGRTPRQILNTLRSHHGN
jgi:hypothetical protein